MAIPFIELNKINPSSVIELFELELTVGLHIPAGNPNNLDTVFRFHAGANLNNFGQIKFNNNLYQRVAVQIEGFQDTSTGTIPRPTLTFSNLGGIDKDSTVMTMTDFLNVVVVLLELPVDLLVLNVVVVLNTVVVTVLC